MPQSKHNLGDCRFYEKKFPEPEESVMAKVERIEKMGAYVSLPEYNDMEGMILLTELSKVRFRSVNRLIRVGRHEVVIVVRVDTVKGYIDLSKRRVSPEDIVKCEERYSRAKKVNQTVRHVAKIHDIRVDELNAMLTWPLEKIHGDAYEALREATLHPDSIFKDLPDFPEDIKKSILHDISTRFAPQSLKMRAKIDLWCFGHEGIDAIKTALSKVKEFETEDVKLTVKLIAPPQYVVLSSSYDKQNCMEIMKETIEEIKNTITKYEGGGFKQQEEIVVLGSEEEKRLEQLLNAFDDRELDLDDDDGDDDDDDDDDDDEDDEEEDEGMGRIEEDDELLKPNANSNHKHIDNPNQAAA